MITVLNLNKEYQNNKQKFLALKNINFHVNKSEVFGIIGKSGAGKSTLIRCINLLEKPSHGKVIINNCDLTCSQESTLRIARRGIGMVFQHFNLLKSRNAFENIALPLELIHTPQKNIKQKVNLLLELINLQDKANHYVNSLSGGQKQRIAIARALIANTKILLCDEITSSLDPEATNSILNLLQKINRELGVTILIITHEMDVIKKICSRVAILEHGEITEQGDVISIFTNPKNEGTKKLTQNTLHLELPVHIKEKLQPTYAPGLNPIIKLTFVGQISNEPIVSTIFERYKVKANILLADLEQISRASIGFIICKLEGDYNSIEHTISYFKNLNITVEVIGYE